VFRDSRSSRLVIKGALIRTEERKHTRYQLNIAVRSVTSVVVNERGELGKPLFQVPMVPPQD